MNHDTYGITIDVPMYHDGVWVTGTMILDSVSVHFFSQLIKYASTETHGNDPGTTELEDQCNACVHCIIAT